MNEETKVLIVTILGDINLDNDDLLLYFEKNIKGKVTQQQIKKIHKDFILQFIKDSGFDPTIFKIKSKDAKYYLVRGWSPKEIILHFNKPVYDYRSIHEIIDDNVLVDLYSEMSMNELSKKINVEYSRLVKHFKNNHITIRNIKASITKDVLDRKKQTMKEKYGYDNPSSVPKFQEKRKKTNIEKYGTENVFSSDTIKDKIKKTNLEKYGVESFTQTTDYLKKVKEISERKYGVEHYTQNVSVKAKNKRTCKEKYGVEFVLQSHYIRDRIKTTMKEKYGYDNPSSVPKFQEKRKKTNIEKYGTEYYFGSDDYWSKTFKTNLKKYGIEYPMQNIDIFQKSMKNSYRKRDYIIDGVEYELQGYEPIVLQVLLEYFSHDEIITRPENMPKIMYNYNKGIKRYIPDFYIPSLSLIIEVKSNYTYNIDLKKNLAKKNACNKQGFDFEFIILERKEILKDDRRIRNIGNRRSNKLF